MKTKFKILVLCLFFLPLGFSFVYAQDTNLTYDVHYPKTIQPGDTLILTVELNVPAGYHVYAPNSDNRNMGHIVTELRFPPRLPEGLLKVGGNKMYDAEGHEIYGEGTGKAVRLVQRFKTPKSIPNTTGEITLSGVLVYQLCEQMVCFSPVEVPIRCVVGIQK